MAKTQRILSRAEVEERLAALPPFDERRPEEWPEMCMAATRCACGRWLQIVRPGKYQCECECEDVRREDSDRELLLTCKQLAEWLGDYLDDSLLFDEAEVHAWLWPKKT